MMKKMATWIGMALMAGSLALACGGKQKTEETTPPPAVEPTGGETYGAPAAGGETYGAPAGGEEGGGMEEGGGEEATP